MNNINKTMDRAVITAYIVFVMIYEYISILNFYGLKNIELYNIINIFLSNFLFLGMSIIILSKYKKCFVQNIINLFLSVSIIIDFIIYLNMNKLYPYSIYLLILILIIKIFVVILNMVEVIHCRRKFKRKKQEI